MVTPTVLKGKNLDFFLLIVSHKHLTYRKMSIRHLTLRFLNFTPNVDSLKFVGMPAQLYFYFSSKFLPSVQSFNENLELWKFWLIPLV